jgi:hypothetical protein
MRSLISTLSFLVFCTSASAFAAGPELATVFVNTGKTSDVITMLRGSGQWKAEASAQFAKLDLRFSSPIALNKVEVQSCGTSFADGADLYVNFDEQVAFAEGGKPVLAIPYFQFSLQQRSLCFSNSLIKRR